MLTLPGASYLLALHEIKGLGYATAPTVLLILLFNVVMLALLELPLAGFVFAPEWTPVAVARAKAWIGEHWHRFALIAFSTVGVLLILKGTIGLIS
jgi:Sap, sulfolipid-1-addressing protein